MRTKCAYCLARPQRNREHAQNNISYKRESSSLNMIFRSTLLIDDLIKVVILTAEDGDGQQCNAAPACTASMELETNGSLEISALTKVKFLEERNIVIK